MNRNGSTRALAPIGVTLVFLGSMVTAALGQAPALPPGLTAVAPPKPIPVFTLPGVNRPALQSTELKGQVVVLRVWATH